MKLATFAVVAAVLVCGAAAFQEPHIPIRPGVTTTKFDGNIIRTNTFNQLMKLPAMLGDGKFKVHGPGKATPKVELTDVGCLNTVMPEPLGWGPLWCPGKEAKVMQWYDEVGSLHRSVDIPLQAGITANMVMWLFSPLYPQFLEFKGKLWYWYHLWHPYDHIMAANSPMATTSYLGGPGLYTLIHEHYRNLPNEKGKVEFETDAWFFVEDLLSNFAKKRIIISINTAGLQAWTLIVNLKDTPQGLKIDNELIIGVAAAGFDKSDPAKGTDPETATVLNENLINPALKAFGGAEGEFERSLNAITRHVVEEFSMFRFFLREVWDKHPLMHGFFDYSDAVTSLMPKLNWGPLMKMPLKGSSGVTAMLTPLNGTKFHDQDAAHAAIAKMPGSISKGMQIKINDSVARLSASTNAVFSSLASGNKTAAARAAATAKVPSAAGAFESGKKPAAVLA